MLERARGVEPLSQLWKSWVMPLYDARIFFVGLLGIEPKPHAPKAYILPLYDSPLSP